jgi:hypothetical protein
MASGVCSSSQERILFDDKASWRTAISPVPMLQGDVPVEGMAETIMELAPASDVFEMVDAALKVTNVRSGLLRVERECSRQGKHSGMVT